MVKRNISLSSGFSLIELMVVMIVIGAVIGLVTVNMDHLTPTTRLNAAGRTIAATFNLAYNQAILLGRDVIMYYDLEKRCTQIIIPKSGTMKEDTLMLDTLPQGVSYQDIMVVGQPAQTKGWLKVYITPTGILQGHIVHLKNDQGQQISIEVNPLTGIVDVIPGYRTLQFEENP